METILHLGVHQTATKIFQSYLDHNATRLEKAGVAVWTPSTIRGGLFSGMVRPPHETSVATERSTSLIGLTCARLRRKATSQLIVSEADMIGTLRANMRNQSLYGELTPRLSRFSKAFGQACDRIILSIRCYETYWASSIGFAQSTGYPTLGASEIARIGNQPRRWNHVIRDIHELFPKAEILVLPYETFRDDAPEMLDLATGNYKLSECMKNNTRRCEIGKKAESSPFDTVTQHKLRRRYAKDLAWLADGAEGMARLLTPKPRTDMDTFGTVRLAKIQHGALTGGHYGTTRRME